MAEQQNSLKLSVTIVGPGAVGLTLGAALSEFCRLGFMTRDGFQAITASIQAPGLRSTVYNFPESSKAGVVCFMCVKAYDLAEAARKTLPHLSPGTVIVSLCNGYVEPILTELARQHPGFIWRYGVTTLAATKTENVAKQMNARARVVWGPFTHSSAASPLTENEQVLLAAVPAHVLQLCYSSDAVWVGREKWLFNVVINSLCAAGNLEHNKMLLSDKAKLHETFEEAWCLGMKLWGTWPLDKAATYEELLLLIEQTAENTNSMVVDVRTGRKTEVDFLTGLARGYTEFPILNKLTSSLTALART